MAKRNPRQLGKPLAEMPNPKELIRFLNKIIVDPETNCWIWQGYRNSKGYGQFWFRGMMHWAHRWSAQVWKGRFNNDIQGHHSCHNPACVNPDHVRPLTCSENTMLGNIARKDNIPI